MGLKRAYISQRGSLVNIEHERKPMSSILETLH